MIQIRTIETYGSEIEFDEEDNQSWLEMATIVYKRSHLWEASQKLAHQQIKEQYGQDKPS